MNNFKPLLYVITCLLLQFLSSCKKDPVTSEPADPVLPTRSFKIAMEGLPGMISPQGNLTAVISVTTKQGQAVFTDKNVLLSYENKYLSPVINLPEGEYTLTKFLVYGNNNTIVYASPLAGSEKEKEVTAALHLPITLTGSNITMVTAYVTIVNNGDTPQHFGYPAGTFITHPADNTVKKIMLRTAIKVGEIMYDSIPSSLRLTVWNQQNEASLSFISLRAGTNEIALPKEASRYQFSVTKWNTTYEKTMTAAEVTAGMQLTLGGEKQARKLSAINTAILVNGMYLAHKKKDFLYGGNGKLATVKHYSKNSAYETILDYTETLFYNDQNKVEKIKQQPAASGVQLEDIFNYYPDGRIHYITRAEAAGITTATVHYIPVADNDAAYHAQKVDIVYGFTQYYYTQNYSLLFSGGTVISDLLTTSHGNYSAGIYNYDFEINPLAHLHKPDLYFEDSWKHNRNYTSMQHVNVFPTFIPLETIYTYDTEGYPENVVIRYKTYLTGDVIHQMKSVFHYV